jgi:ABC-type sugar transport system permease subunit
MARTGTTSAGQEGTFALWRAALREVTRERWGDWSGYLFVFPAVAMFLLFNAWPIIRGLTIAVQDYRFLYEDHRPFNGLDNFIEMAGDKIFWESLGRSAHFWVLYVPLMVLVPLTVATLIARVRRPVIAGVYRTISYLPVILPIAVAMLLWRHLFNGQFGYLNYFLNKILGPGVAPNWTSDHRWVMIAIVISAVWKGAGYNTMLFLIGLYNINSELYEAASLDGAGPWKQFLYVTLPLLKPIVTIVLVLAAGAIGVTAEPMIWFGSIGGPAGPRNSALTAGYYAYKVAFLYGDLRWGYAAAINLTLGILSMLMATVAFRVLRSKD